MNYVTNTSTDSRLFGHLPKTRSIRIAQCVHRPVGCAGINRHEAGNERFLRERSSEPLGPEFCAVYREVHGEA
jgi:hypothetical protein